MRFKCIHDVFDLVVGGLETDFDLAIAKSEFSCIWEACEAVYLGYD